MKRIIVLLIILALSSLACADPTADCLSASSASGEHGATNVPVLLNITNVMDGPIQGMAFDVIYDNNVITLVKAKRGSDLPTDDGDPVWSVKLGTNKKSITMYTDDQDYALANGTTGNIAKLYFNVTGTAGETSPIELSDMDISSTGFVHGTIPAINGTFTVLRKKGDLDCNEIVNIMDVRLLSNHVFNPEGYPVDNEWAGDIDDSDSIDITDV